MNRVIYYSCILAFVILSASNSFPQNPHGGIVFVLFDSMSNQIFFPEISFMQLKQKQEISDITGKYKVRAFDKIGNSSCFIGTHKDSIFGNYPAIGTGFGGNFQLQIIRESDTMLINLNYVCNEGFGLKIFFNKGTYNILVCDTTKLPCKRQEGWCHKPLEEQYNNKFLGGYDLTNKLLVVLNRKKDK